MVLRLSHPPPPPLAQLVPLVDVAVVVTVAAVAVNVEGTDDATKLLLPAVAAAAKKVASEKALAAIVGSIISKLYG